MDPYIILLASLGLIILAVSWLPLLLSTRWLAEQQASIAYHHDQGRD